MNNKRDFDINVEGVAHYGLLPDFWQDLINIGITHKELSALFRSAEAYIEMWETIEKRAEELKVAARAAPSPP